MSICFVVERLGKPSETFVRRDLVELARKGADIIVYELGPPRPGDVEVPEELEGAVFTSPGLFSLGTFFSKLRWLIFHPLRVCGILGIIPRALLRPLGGIRELFGANRAFRLASLVRKHRVERIHCEFATMPATVGWVASRLARVPFSISVHAWDIFVYRTMLKAKLRAADLVVACSECAADYLSEKLGVPGGKIELVHHGLDLDEYSYVRHRPDPRPLRVLAVGRLVEKKGFRYLVEAVALLRKRGIACECIIIGDGPRERKLVRLAEKRGVFKAVAFAGAADVEEVRDAMLEAHMLVAPSVKTRRGDSDGIPNVVLEAMARGTAVIATDAGGLAEVVHDGETGIIVEQRSAEDLAAAIRRFAEEPALADRMAAGGRKLVEREFDIRLTAGLLLDALSDAGGEVGGDDADYDYAEEDRPLEDDDEEDDFDDGDDAEDAEADGAEDGAEGRPG